MPNTLDDLKGTHGTANAVGMRLNSQAKKTSSIIMESEGDWSDVSWHQTVFKIGNVLLEAVVWKEKRSKVRIVEKLKSQTL